jgi:hypothetical protein
MRLALCVLTVLIILSWGAYRLWQEPRVRDLFGASEPGLRSGTSIPLKNKLVVLRSTPSAQTSAGKAKPAPDGRGRQGKNGCCRRPSR